MIFFGAIKKSVYIYMNCGITTATYIKYDTEKEATCADFSGPLTFFIADIVYL